MIANLYQEMLMDHYKNPRNRGEIVNPHFASRVHNPSCGDAIGMQGTIKDGVIDIVMFTGHGCVISQAFASLLTEKVKGMQVQEVVALDKNIIETMLGINLGPTRLKCALLSLQALQMGVTL